MMNDEHETEGEGVEGMMTGITDRIVYLRVIQSDRIVHLRSLSEYRADDGLMSTSGSEERER